MALFLNVQQIKSASSLWPPIRQPAVGNLYLHKSFWHNAKTCSDNNRHASSKAKDTTPIRSLSRYGPKSSHVFSRFIPSAEQFDPIPQSYQGHGHRNTGPSQASAGISKMQPLLEILMISTADRRMAGRPRPWDAVRHRIYDTGKKGMYALTGSAMPNGEGFVHSGTGRIEELPREAMMLLEPTR